MRWKAKRSGGKIQLSEFTEVWPSIQTHQFCTFNSWIRHLSTISEDLPLHSLPFLEASYWLSIKSVPAWFYTLMPQDGSDLAHAFAHLSIWEEVVNILESIWDWDPHFQRSLPAASWTSSGSLVRYDDDSGKSKCSDYLLYQFMFLHCGFPSCLMGQAPAHTIFLWSFNLQLNRMQIYPGSQLDLQALGKTVEMEVLWSPPTLSCRAQGYGLTPASVNLVGLKSLLGGNQHLRLGWSTLRIRRGIFNADFIKRCMHSNNHFLIPFEPFLPTTGNFSLTLPGSPSLYSSYSPVGEGRKWHRTKPFFFVASCSQDKASSLCHLCCSVGLLEVSGSRLANRVFSHDKLCFPDMARSLLHKSA